ncbi:MAG: DUF1559 domain-containing protein [Gemmataceae bacterium]|nr:DUF1559 domain-containing protein [Gemmataceae bacterium]
MACRRRSRLGFSLVELLVVIGILSVLMALLLPAVQRVRQSAQQTQCLNNLRQIGLGLRGYEAAHKNFPPAFTFISNLPPSQTTGHAPLGPKKLVDSHLWMLLYYGLPYTGIDTAPGWGWGAHILPYIDQEAAFCQIDFHEPIELDRFQAVRTTAIPIYQCPADYEAGVYLAHSEVNTPLVEVHTISYASSYGTTGQPGEQPDIGDGVFYRNSKTRLADVTDGLSTTFAVGERAALFAKAPWVGALSRAGMRTTPGAPVLLAGVEEAPTQAMARAGVIPLNDPYSMPYDFFSPHRSYVNFLFCDGAARRLATSTSVNVIAGFATRSGGETGQIDF